MRIMHALGGGERSRLKNSRVNLFQQFSFNESVFMKQINVDANGWLLHLWSALIESKTYVYLFMIFLELAVGHIYIRLRTSLMEKNESPKRIWSS